MQGQIVGAANLLIRSGMTRLAAAKWLELERAKQKTGHANRSRITGRQILKWRERINAGKASEAACLMADEVRSDHAAMSDLTAIEGKRAALALLKTIRRMIP
jgi:hypothetical protein